MFIFFDKITIVHGYGLPKKTSRSQKNWLK